MQFPKGVEVEKVLTPESGDLTNEAKNALWKLVDKDLEITIRARIKYVGSRVLTIEATDAYDMRDVIGVRASDILKLEVHGDE
jgi:hypothetical protein